LVGLALVCVTTEDGWERAKGETWFFSLLGGIGYTRVMVFEVKILSTLWGLCCIMFRGMKFMEKERDKK